MKMRWKICSGRDKKEEALLVLRRIVSLEPSQANHLRLAELAAELGEHGMASQSFLQIGGTGGSCGGERRPVVRARLHGESSGCERSPWPMARACCRGARRGRRFLFSNRWCNAGDASLELRDLYAQALLAADRCVESEPLIWQMFEQNPARIHQVVTLIGKMIDSELDAEAVALARKLEAFQRRRGERRSFIATMQELLASHRPSAEMLEFLAELFNASNRETDYAQALLKLFDLYCAKHDYQKAGECLDRAAEVDPYEPGHQKRLEALRGKIDDQRFHVIASRFATTVKKEEPEVKSRRADAGSGRAAGPHAASGNSGAVRDALEGDRAPAAHSGTVSARGRAQSRNCRSCTSRLASNRNMRSRLRPRRRLRRRAPAKPVAVSEAADVSSLARVAEITRKLYHQGNAEGVLKTAASEIGENWRTARCIVALRKPGLPPSSVQEYHMDGLIPASSAALVSLVETVQDLAVARGTVTIGDAPERSGVDGRAPCGRRVADRIAPGSAADRRQWP